MNGKYLLDTNIVIALLGKDTDVIAHLERGGEIFIPSVVIGELYYGAEKSSKAEENKTVIDKFASDNVILNCTKETARYYGDVKNNLIVRHNQFISIIKMSSNGWSKGEIIALLSLLLAILVYLTDVIPKIINQVNPEIGDKRETIKNYNISPFFPSMI